MSATAGLIASAVAVPVLWAVLVAGHRAWTRAAERRFDAAHPTLLALHQQAQRHRTDHLHRIEEP